MLHEIHPHTFTNEFNKNAAIAAADFVFYFRGNELLLMSMGVEQVQIPQKRELESFLEITNHVYLFRLNDRNCFLVWGELRETDARFEFREISFFRISPQPEIAWSSLLAHQLLTWYERNRFCSICGSKTQHKPDERAIVCTNCNVVVYPNISPAVIVAILSDDKILLARGVGWAEGRYSLLAGYVDIGETLEQTVVREVKEEVGIAIHNISYYKSQPWPLSGSMMVGFIAYADEKQPLHLDANEIAEAAWFKRGELPDHPPALSIAGEMIEKFEKGELSHT